MCIGNRALNTLRSESGASLIFVLGLMLLFIAVGISALAAAGTNAGTDIDRRSLNQLNMYTDSLQRSIMYSLQTSREDKNKSLNQVGSLSTLGGRMLAASYNEVLGSGGDKAEITLDIMPELSDSGFPVDIGVSASVVVNFMSSVKITEFKAEKLPESEGDIYEPRQPQTAEIGGDITVTVTAKYKGRTVISAAEYGLIREGFLEDRGDAAVMYIVDPGEWRFVSYERVDLYQ